MKSSALLINRKPCMTTKVFVGEKRVWGRLKEKVEDSKINRWWQIGVFFSLPKYLTVAHRRILHTYSQTQVWWLTCKNYMAFRCCAKAFGDFSWTKLWLAVQKPLWRRWAYPPNMELLHNLDEMSFKFHQLQQDRAFRERALATVSGKSLQLWFQHRSSALQNQTCLYFPSGQPSENGFTREAVLVQVW